LLKCGREVESMREHLGTEQRALKASLGVDIIDIEDFKDCQTFLGNQSGFFKINCRLKKCWSHRLIDIMDDLTSGIIVGPSRLYCSSRRVVLMGTNSRRTGRSSRDNDSICMHQVMRRL
jgi:hypothetical protein